MYIAHAMEYDWPTFIEKIVLNGAFSEVRIPSHITSRVRDYHVMTSWSPFKLLLMMMIVQGLTASLHPV